MSSCSSCSYPSIPSLSSIRHESNAVASRVTHRESFIINRIVQSHPLFMLRGLWFTHREWKHKICHHNVIFLLHVKTVVYSESYSFPISVEEHPFKNSKSTHNRLSLPSKMHNVLWLWFGSIRKSPKTQSIKYSRLLCQLLSIVGLAGLLTEENDDILCISGQMSRCPQTMTRIKIHPFCLQCTPQFKFPTGVSARESSMLVNPQKHD